jgi:tyrosyl-tRNA synthetase
LEGRINGGNIVNGTDLIRRILHKEAYGLTSPLITTASGAKMGKTEKGAIWLNEDKLTPYDYWQFWRNTDDRDVVKFLKFFTEIKPREIDDILKKESNINNLKILLANEATKILHGEPSSKKAEQTAKETFESGGLGADLPEIKIHSFKINKGISILDLIFENKILPSKSEARRAIANKGFKIDDKTIDDEKKIIKLKDFKNNILKLSYGKKKHYLVKIIYLFFFSIIFWMNLGVKVLLG